MNLNYLYMMESKVKKTVLITGAARRIGRALAINFCNKGWRVLLHYNTSENEANSVKEMFPDQVHLLQADLRNEDDINDMFANIKENSIDVLINNAAIFPDPLPFAEYTYEKYQNVINSNLFSVFLVSNRYVRTNKQGRIINFASLGAKEVWSGRSAYHAAKAGVEHLTRSMAKDLAPDFQVNSISPGVIEIPGDDTDDKSIAFENRIPMKRFGNTDDIFDAVYFFSTCSKYITGQDLSVDGGWNKTR
ncbi:MAG: 3-oxoacyl-[acyl-carrier-protein] reductase [Candidatus Kapaibacteriales bacterium]